MTKQEMIEQLISLKENAKANIDTDEIFKKDYEALEIALKLINEQETEIKQLKRENRELKVGINNGLDKEKKGCFYEDGHTGKCLGYSFFNDDEPCVYCQTCDAINIKEDD